MFSTQVKSGMLATVLCLIFTFSSVSAQGCSVRNYNYDSFVCVCSETYCDWMEPIEQTNAGVVQVYESNQKSDRFKKTILNFQEIPSNCEVTATVDRSKRYQKIIGFGGAATDAAGINRNMLPPSMQEDLVKVYYSPQGLEYNMIRVPMGGCDFSTHEYTYADDPDDFDLKNFSLTKEDYDYKIPIIKAAEKYSNKPLKIFGSPWTAPNWMKTNNASSGRGSLIGKPCGKYYKTWANYFVRFLKAYEEQNITFWGLTAQNEPIDGLIPYFPFNSMAFTPESQREFIKCDLGPALQQAGFGIDKVNLMIMDDQRILLPTWAVEVLEDKEAAQYIGGIAFHWYSNFLAPSFLLDLTHHFYPNFPLISTEACSGYLPWDKPKVQLGNWKRAEDYAHDIIEDLNHYTTAWVDWNLYLDLEGGPNWAKNFVDSPIIVNASAKEFYKQPMFYVLAHFSKFIPPDSVNIGISKGLTGLEFTAFETPKGDTVVICLNRHSASTTLVIHDPIYGYVKNEVQPHSIQTYVWQAKKKYFLF